MLNWVAINAGGAAVLDLKKLFADLTQNPGSAANWWVYIMLLSTLVPTLIHMMIASVSLILWAPEHYLKNISKGWKEQQLQHDLPKFLLAWGYLSVVTPLAVVAPFAMLYAMVCFLLEPGYSNELGNWLLATSRQFAATFDPSL